MLTNFDKYVDEDFLIYSVQLSIQKRAGTTDASCSMLVLFTQLNRGLLHTKKMLKNNTSIKMKTVIFCFLNDKKTVHNEKRKAHHRIMFYYQAI